MFSTAWTFFFAVVWWVYTPHDGRRVANSAAQEAIRLGAGVNHTMTEAQVASAANILWHEEKGVAAAVIALSWLAKVRRTKTSGSVALVTDVGHAIVCRYTLRSCCTRMRPIYAGARSTRFAIGVCVLRSPLVTIRHSWRRKMTTKSFSCLPWEHTIPMAPSHIYLTSLAHREGMDVIPQNRAEAHWERLLYPCRGTGRFSSRETIDNTILLTP